ncbi:FHA domain-containing protein [Streptomyces sp. NPDC050619]|uniref:FHA domain-containing protein n=1 Tax=Streptomyces sp. NPDC050619 TaxID=3157214 RepID=UPI00343BF6C3
MQIRLTVVDPLGPPDRATGRAASRDVLLTAPAGTALAAVASALSGGEGAVVLYAGAERLDTQRCTLGEPPLIDGAVLSLGAPGEPEAHPELDGAPAQLQVVAGPDAGGVHLLHGGQIHIGRSADADVPLDDPDVSRLHCAVTVAADGRVSVADLDSTNGTTLDGTRVGTRPVRFTPGALLRLGESALRLAPAGGPGARVRTAPDGEGHVRVPAETGATQDAGPAVVPTPTDRTHHAYGSAGWGASTATPGAQPHAAADPPIVVPGQGGAPGIETRGARSYGRTGDVRRDSSGGDSGETHGGRLGTGGISDAGPGDGGRGRGRSSGAGSAGGISDTGTDGGGAFGAGTGDSGEIHAGRLGPDAPTDDSDGDCGWTHGGPTGAAAPDGTASPLTGRDRRTRGGRLGAGTAGGTSGETDGNDGRMHGGPTGAAASGGTPGPATGNDSRTRGGRLPAATPDGTSGETGRDDGRTHRGPTGPAAPGESRTPAAGNEGRTRGGRLGAGTARGTSGETGGNDGRMHGGPTGTAASGGTPGPATGNDSRTRGGRLPAGTARGASGQADADGGRTYEGPTGPSPRGGAPADHAHAAPSEADGSADDAPGVAGNDGRRKGTPLRGTDVPQGVRKRGGLSAWARRLTGGRGEQDAARRGTDDEGVHPSPAEPPATAPRAPETWPDPAALLLTALGPGPRLWERGPGHPETLTVRLGTADRAAPDGSGLLPAVPVTADLREVGALGLAGPRTRLAGLARAVVSQLAALHSPETLEIVLISADRARPLEERTAEWSWLGWLPHLRPSHGQDCRLLLAYDREQATARTDELLRRLEDHLADAGRGQNPTLTLTGRGPQGPEDDARHEPSRAAGRRPSWAKDDHAAGERGSAPGETSGSDFAGPYTVVVVDGAPGGAAVREAVARLALEGPQAGIHVVCLAETAPASPASPVTETYETACAASPAFRECGAVALLSGDVATALRLMRVARTGTETRTPQSRTPQPGPAGPAPAEPGTAGPRPAAPATAGPGPVGPGTIAAVDAVSLAWAERFARALAPLRAEGAGGERHARVSAPLPQAARLLDELGLARATPASLMARWADAADDTESLGGRARAVLGAGPRGPVCADLAADGPHLLIEGPPGSGRTELLRAVVASLAAAERPDRLGIVLIDGRDSTGTGGGGHGEGLRVCTDVPHVSTHLTANDPVRMREFAQSLSAELKRRAELLGRSDFAEWHTGREVSGRIVAQRTPSTRGADHAGTAAGDLDSPPSSTIRLRPAARRAQTESVPPLPRLVVIVDDLDALVSPALGSPGRPAAGSVIRALEAVAREGERLGVHLVAAAGLCGRTAQSEPARRATLRVALDPLAPGPDEPAPGRGRLAWADGRVTAFQGGRVTGRIPRTATLRPTVVPLEWERMGDPPARRPVRELGNGPTDLALLASALERAAREVSATQVPSLI